MKMKTNLNAAGPRYSMSLNIDLLASLERCSQGESEEGGGDEEEHGEVLEIEHDGGCDEMESSCLI